MNFLPFIFVVLSGDNAHYFLQNSLVKSSLVFVLVNGSSNFAGCR
jgi:hypothetical protein